MIEPIDLAGRVRQLWETQAQSRRVPKAHRLARRADLTVRDLPSSERPRERLAALGTQALSGQELLACLLGRGFSGESVMTTAQRLLNRFGGLYGISQAPVEELSRVKGIGLAKAAQLKAACEFSRRAEGEPARLSGTLHSPAEAIPIARRHVAGRKKEHFIVLMLDARHRLFKVAEISIGSLEMSIVHPRETFQEAITAGASALILAHNHPSGDPTPSPEDLELTRRLVEAGKLLGIPVLDHLIIAGERDLSLQASGFFGDSDADA